MEEAEALVGPVQEGCGRRGEARMIVGRRMHVDPSFTIRQEHYVLGMRAVHITCWIGLLMGKLVSEAGYALSLA